MLKIPRNIADFVTEDIVCFWFGVRDHFYNPFREVPGR